jgi:hypothetical protein
MQDFESHVDLTNGVLSSLRNAKLKPVYDGETKRKRAIVAEEEQKNGVQVVNDGLVCCC